MKNKQKNTRKHGFRYCHDCGKKLQKRGKNRGGAQRWFYPFCNVSTTKHNGFQRLIEQFKQFTNWTLTKLTIAQAAPDVDRKTFYNRATKWMKLDYQIPVSDKKFNCLIVDSTCIKRFGLMVLKTPKTVLNYRWAPSENNVDYYQLFIQYKAPNFLVTDGHSAIEAACKKAWKITKIQRCFVHILRFVKNNVGVSPTELPKISITKLALKLFDITCDKQAKNWVKCFWREYELHKS